MDEVIGKVVGNYVVEDLLGEGGMGAVYRGRHLTLPRHVAIKVLHKEYSERREITARFVQEAIAAAHVDHEHVVNALDTGALPDGRLCVILEYLEGMDLERKLDEVGRLGEEDALYILCQMCAPLSKAHSLGIVHRDLKPANIFLTGRYGLPFVKVLDFGIAKVKASLKVTGIETDAGRIMGTPAYMAPEQAHSPDRIDSRADVFAVGGILFRMLTGVLPWNAETAAGYILAKRESPAPLVGSIVPGLSPIWDVAIARCLTWEQDQRYHDLPSLVADLVEGIEGGPAGVPDGHRIRDQAWPDYASVAGPHAATTRARFTAGPRTAGGTVTNAAGSVTTQPRSARRRLMIGGVLLAAIIVGAVMVAASGGDRDSVAAVDASVAASTAVVSSADAGVQDAPTFDAVSSAPATQGIDAGAADATLVTDASIDAPIRRPRPSRRDAGTSSPTFDPDRPM